MYPAFRSPWPHWLITMRREEGAGTFFLAELTLSPVYDAELTASAALNFTEATVTPVYQADIEINEP